MSTDVLRHMRESISSIDRAIIDLLAARLKLVESLGRVKTDLQRPVYDPAREVEVLAAVREAALKLGLDPDFVAEVYASILRYSRCAQLDCRERVRILIYGYGRMARTLAKHMVRAGCWVGITGRNPEKVVQAARDTGAQHLDEMEALDWADIVLYAVPPNALLELLRRHSRRLRESQLVLDILSVKKPFVDEAAKILPEQVEYASLHPLFGPLECPAGETIAVTPIRLETWKQRLERLLEGLGFRVEYVDPDKHDKVMAVNQVLHHIILELFVHAKESLIKALGISEGDTKLLVTYSLRNTLAVAERVLSMIDVVREIRRYNRYSTLVVETLQELIANLKNLD